MFIQCTRLLLEKGGLMALAMEDIDQIFAWHAHFFTMNRKNHVVVMNNKCRFSVILSDMKAKDLRKFQDEFEKALKTVFEIYGLSEEIYEKYIETSPGVLLSLTSDKKVLGCINEIIKSLNFGEHGAPLNGKVNPEYVKLCNSIPFPINRKLVFPEEVFLGEIKKIL